MLSVYQECNEGRKKTLFAFLLSKAGRYDIKGRKYV